MALLTSQLYTLGGFLERTTRSISKEGTLYLSISTESDPEDNTLDR